MTTNTGGQAFPIADAYAMSTEKGMTLRDYFAAKAMQAIYRSQVEWQSTSCPADEESLQVFAELAGDAYALADAMLKAREA